MRKAIDQFIDNAEEDGNEKLEELKLNKSQQDLCDILFKILFSFKVTSKKIQFITCPQIDQVFQTYETLFNSIDILQETLNQ